MSVSSSVDYLLRTLPVKDAASNRSNLQTLIGSADVSSSVKSRLDFPLILLEDPDSKNKKYFACELNRFGSSYRSPWSNKFYPPIKPEDVESAVPSEKLRALEVEANELFESYKDLYYMGGASGSSSAYFKDDPSAGAGRAFTACFLIKKVIENNEYVQKGVWESVNYISASFNEAGTEAVYKLTTTVRTVMDVNKANVGSTNVSGFVTKQSEVASKVDASRTVMSVIGRMVEDMETDIRLGLNDVYVLKTKEILSSVRSAAGASASVAPSRSHMETLNKAVLGLGLKKDGPIVGGGV